MLKINVEMIGQFSLNFLEIVVDIKSGTKFMMRRAEEFVKLTTFNMKIISSKYLLYSSFSKDSLPLLSL